MYTMYSDYHFTADSFGSECPTNWQEVADYLNARADAIIAAMGADAFELDGCTLTPDAREALDRLYEAYCGGDLSDAPEAQFDA